MVRSKSYIEGSTSQYRPIKPAQAALIIDFRAREHTAPDCGCAMLTAVYETMLRLRATSLSRKLETVGGDAGTGQTWLAFGNWRWPFSGLVVERSFSPRRMDNLTSIIPTDYISVDIFEQEYDTGKTNHSMSICLSVYHCDSKTRFFIYKKSSILYINIFFTSAVFIRSNFKTGVHFRQTMARNTEVMLLLQDEIHFILHDVQADGKL